MSLHLVRTFTRLSLKNHAFPLYQTQEITRKHVLPAVTFNIVRHLTFFNEKTAEQLWKGVMSVSNAGRKRGRARGRRAPPDLNKGQRLGVGKEHIIWPGLNAPIIKMGELLHQKRMPTESPREQLMAEARLTGLRRTREKLHPLERGWTGGKMGGRSMGAPDPTPEESFEGFDSKILEFKQVHHMSGTLGRIRQHSATLLVGNKNGICGVAIGKSMDSRAAIKSAKNRAAKRLFYIKRYDEHTVMHDFYTQFWRTKIFVSKKPKGYGLVCHRIIKACCELIGIKDLHAKVEGSTTPQYIIKAFLIGLLKQKSFEEMAEDKKLHIVEFDGVNHLFPKLIASPSVCRKAEEIPHDEDLDFTRYCMGGKIGFIRPRQEPFYTRLPSWQIHLTKQERKRDHDKTGLRLRAKYGRIQSFLGEKYPEAKHILVGEKYTAGRQKDD